jgi:D-serine deaminase-like pyridoxal phosphate-dependent protein
LPGSLAAATITVLMPRWYEISNAADIPSPALLVYPDRIEENLRRTVAAAGGAERLRPHVKTHKMPEVIRLCLAHGIRAFKAATIAEAEMTAAAGAADVLLAYPVVGPAAFRLAELVRRFPGTRIRGLADSDVGIDDLARAAAAAGVRIDTLLDLNVGMNRTGVACGPEAARLARRIARSPGLAFGGLHAYDGHLTDADHARLVGRVEAAFAPVWWLRDELVAAGIPVPLVVAAGTPTTPILAARGDVEVGAGTTLLWDFGQPMLSPDLDFLHAAVLLARVVSQPAPGRLCLDLGHKAVASEMPHPRVSIFGLEEATFPMHSEEHLVVETPQAAEFPVGTVVYALPRHVCPTVALHEEVVVVRNGRAADRWRVAARARRISI